MLAIEGLLIGLLQIALIAVLLSIVVYAIIYAAGAFGYPVPAAIQKLLWAAVMLVVLIMIIMLLFSLIRGTAAWHPFRAEGITGGAVATLSPATI